VVSGAAADARVLGQLLVMQSIIGSLPDAAIMSFVVEGLADIPGIGNVIYHPEAGANGRPLTRLALNAPSASFGELSFLVTDETAFAPYPEYLRNFSFMLALILEGRQRARDIADHQATLETRVRERTEALKASEERWKFALEGAGDGVWDWNIQTGGALFSRRWKEMIGYAENEIEDSSAEWSSRVHPDDLPDVMAAIQAHLDGQTASAVVEFRMQNKDGHWQWILGRGMVVSRDADGKPLRLVGTNTDITERRTAADKIEHLAFYDALTELPNRRLLRDRLEQAVTSSNRHNRHGALLLLDMDDFKTLNDTLGHDIGDQFLVEIARRLKASVREGDTVARLGGDEFVVILEDLNEDTLAAMQAESAAVKILRAVSQPYLLDLSSHDGLKRTRSYHCTSSIGITLFDGNAITVDELIKRADTAMYQAKALGRDSLRFFDPEMQAEVTARAALDDDLREALREGQFCLYYQPQVDSTGNWTGAEALVRWQHPRRGMVSPAEFIPQAEVTGLILPLGHWILETACAQLVVWDNLSGMSHLTVAVNVSARQFRHVDFVDHVLAIIDSTGADPTKLKLELTESLLFENVDDVIFKMHQLKAEGIGFSLDDFGTGYSSLAYLKRLPLDQLKIDRSFVTDVLTDANDAAIARTIVALAQSMGLTVIAEGVETEAQREFLAANGCTAYQGYFFGRPMPIGEFSQGPRATA
jgi:diguanylate cyclase (GGDEF)-like protein/PAS domain S-box-containing protein